MNMSPEYMAELHKFLYLSNDTNIERLKSVVATHLNTYHTKHYIVIANAATENFKFLKEMRFGLQIQRNFLICSMPQYLCPIESILILNILFISVLR